MRVFLHLSALIFLAAALLRRCQKPLASHKNPSQICAQLGYRTGRIYEFAKMEEEKKKLNIEKWKFVSLGMIVIIIIYLIMLETIFPFFYYSINSTYLTDQVIFLVIYLFF